jgi:hypothetical protein
MEHGISLETFQEALFAEVKDTLKNAQQTK